MTNMVNTGLSSAAPKVRCRRIEDADAGEVVALLTRGFAPRRPRRFWEQVIAHLGRRAVPPGAPRYGFLLENEGAAVGAILQIFGRRAGQGCERSVLLPQQVIAALGVAYAVFDNQVFNLSDSARYFAAASG